MSYGKNTLSFTKIFIFVFLTLCTQNRFLTLNFHTKKKNLNEISKFLFLLIHPK